MDRSVRSAPNGDVRIAYEVVGDGPIELVYTASIWSNLDVMWEEPRWARYLSWLASFSRLIMFDMRGVGLSDRGSEPPVIEVQMDDISAVMDAAGSRAGSVFGAARGAAPALLFAASYPECTPALVLYALRCGRSKRPTSRGAGRKSAGASPTNPWSRRRGPARTSTKSHRTPPTTTGSSSGGLGSNGWSLRPAHPGARRGHGQIDVRSVLPRVQVPTLVLHRDGHRIVDVGQSRYAAQSIPGARFVELPGADHLPFLGDQAIRSALAIAEGVRALGIEVRAGVHTGECQVVAFRDMRYRRERRESQTGR